MTAAHCLRRGARSVAALVLTALLAACAGRHMQQSAMLHGTRQPATGEGYYRVGTPYEVNGVWYYPRVNYHYDRTGIASWYGARYNGRLTANGEIFDMNGLSAAHPTLPLPSVVRVTDLQNGRSLDLRVNDRGPFANGRIIDLSRRAAQLLGFERQGTAPVRVRILKQQSIKVAELAREGVIAGGVMVARAAPAAAPAPPVRIARAVLPAPLPPPRPAPVEVAVNPPPVYEQPYEPAAVAPARLAALRPVRRNVDFVAYRPPLQHSFHPISYRLPDRDHYRPMTYRLPTLRPVRLAVYRPGRERIFVQAGAFSLSRNAWRVRSRIAGLASVRVSTATIRGVELYRVRLGPFASVEQANRVLSRVIRSGYPGARLVLD